MTVIKVHSEPVMRGACRLVQIFAEVALLVKVVVLQFQLALRFAGRVLSCRCRESPVGDLGRVAYQECP